MSSEPRIAKVCIATFELKGFSSGGIGVLTSNLLKTYSRDFGIEISILWYGRNRCDSAIFAAAYPGCDIFDVDEWSSLDLDEGRVWPSERNCLNDWHWKAVKAARALRAIERARGPFDVVEFPDFAGVALPSIQERRLGTGLKTTAIAVRIHSTEALLRKVDHRPAHANNPVTHDLERLALANADVVVAHLHPVADSVAEHFGFPTSWRTKVVVELPPVVVDLSPPPSHPSINLDTPILFTSKIQWFKRPHVFINAVCNFITNEHQYNGDAILLAHVIDNELMDHCRNLIPASLKDRIFHKSDLSDILRETLISNSVVVFPTSYESFCLAAYEASMLGAIVVVNSLNPAFGPNTPWIDGVNCIKFDGSVMDLSSKIKNIFETSDLAKLSKINIRIEDKPYWLNFVDQQYSLDIAESDRTVSPTTLTVVIAVFDECVSWLDSALSALAIEGHMIEIIVVSSLKAGIVGEKDADFDTRSDNIRIRFEYLMYNSTISELYNTGIRLATGDFVALIPGSCVYFPEFIERSLSFLRNFPEFSFVVPQQGFFSANYQGREIRLSGRMFVGEAVGSSIRENISGGLCFVGRCRDFEEVLFDEDLDRYADLDFFCRAAALGYRVLADNCVGVLLESSLGIKPPFRSHLDAVLTKHRVGNFGTTLALAYDATADGPVSTNKPLPKPVPSNNKTSKKRRTRRLKSLRINGQPLSYYKRQRYSWWRIAIRHPMKPLRWLLTREFAHNRKKRKAERT